MKSDKNSRKRRENKSSFDPATFFADVRKAQDELRRRELSPEIKPEANPAPVRQMPMGQQPQQQGRYAPLIGQQAMQRRGQDASYRQLIKDAERPSSGWWNRVRLFLKPRAS